MVLTIRKAQFEQFSRIETERFYQRVLDFVEENLPADPKYTRDDLRQRLPGFHQQCREVGMESERSVAFLFCMSLAIRASVFAQARLETILNRRDRSETERCDRLAREVLG